MAGGHGRSGAALSAVADQGDRGSEVARLLAVIGVQNRLAATALDLGEIMSVVAASAAQLTGADAGVVELAEGDEMVYRGVSGTAEQHAGLRLKAAASLSGRCVAEGRPMCCHDAATDGRVDRDASIALGAVSMVCVPLPDEHMPGALKVYAARPNAFGDLDIETLAQLSEVIVAHMRRAEEFERSVLESRQDLLSGAGNRRAYEERVTFEVARAQRYGHPLALIIFDLDGFKAVNDQLGHPAGDDVLRRVGSAMHEVRQVDECFRIGGDEFAIVLPDTGCDGATTVAARVAARIAELNHHEGVTASFGVAEHSGGDWSDLHATADAALLTAKRSRR